MDKTGAVEGGFGVLQVTGAKNHLFLRRRRRANKKATL